VAAAAQRQHLDVVLGARQPADFLRDLVGQLARRAQHQRLHGKAARVELGQQGRAKAAVLPLPVLAWAIRSWPARASGRLAAWIGVIAS
jgi:ABC-type amino acid transport substrate-binding protein